MTFYDDYNKFMNTGGVHDDAFNAHDNSCNVHSDSCKSNNRMRIEGCTKSEFMSFMMGGLSSLGDIPPQDKSRIMHMIAEKIGFSHQKASDLLRILNENAYYYQENKGKTDE